jgi:chemosensory pili system protein ChpC
MAVVTEELFSLLIPFGPDRIIVPRACVAEVVRFNPQPTSTKSDRQPAEWLRGTTGWNNRQIPVISFEALCGREAPKPGGRTRVVVFHPLGGSGDCPPYGVLSEGFPQMVKVNREVVDLDESFIIPEGVPLICRISMLKEQALIPDLEAVERHLAAELPS